MEDVDALRLTIRRVGAVIVMVLGMIVAELGSISDYRGGSPGGLVLLLAAIYLLYSWVRHSEGIATAVEKSGNKDELASTVSCCLSACSRSSLRDRGVNRRRRIENIK